MDAEVQVTHLTVACIEYFRGMSMKTVGLSLAFKQLDFPSLLLQENPVE